MTNLRWILLFAGLAILLLLYFSGRPRKAQNKTDAHGRETHGRENQGRENQARELDARRSDSESRGGAAAASDYDRGLPEPTFDPDALAADLAVNPGQNRHGLAQVPSRDVLMEGINADEAYADPAVYREPAYPHPDEDPRAAAHARARSGQSAYTPEYGTDYAQDPSELTTSDLFGNLDPDDLERPGGPRDDLRSRSASEPYGLNPPQEHSQSMGTSIGEKIEAFSARLTPKRKSRIAANAPAEPAQDSQNKTKIVSLHVVAPSGQIIDGQLLRDTFESRGYHHGDMDIYHSLHAGKTVFSIAKMVMPGVFDVNDVSTYETPGITLFLQLPGPVQGDVAFEVLISEAHELASALGCNILDSERSTLSRQTVQHLRESVYEYMHRQKYFNKVPG
ncbi:MAG: hypothetical protein KTR33_01020 [Gammaproteobacteria bacterium]|nr:hypothetical protein [Gammaproteobacteria bacterium]